MGGSVANSGSQSHLRACLVPGGERDRIVCQEVPIAIAQFPHYHPRGGSRGKTQRDGTRARTGHDRTCRGFLARYYALGSKQRNKSIG